MLNTKQIFNIVRLGKDTEYLSVIINTNDNGIHSPIGAPLIVSKKDFEDEKSKSIRGVFPFPFQNGQQPGKYYSLNKAHLIPITGECFANNGRIKIVPEFEASKLDSLLKYVKDNGSMTFNIEAKKYKYGILMTGRDKKTAESVCNFLDKLYEMCETYKYSSYFYARYSKEFKSTDASDIFHTVSFLDLYNCVPIFNHRKVDGVGVIFNMSLGTSTKVTGSLATRACIALVLSNYKDNIFTTDGIQVNKIKTINSSLIKQIKNVVMAGAGIKNKFKVKEDSEEVEINKGWIDTASVLIDSSARNNMSTTSTGYYYTNYTNS